MEDVTLNKVELASDLASDRLEAEFEGQIYDDPTAGITVYTDEAQEAWNEYYATYLELIENCQQYCESKKEYNI